MKKYFIYSYFFINWAVLFFHYYPARYGRFVHDFMSWAYTYNHFNWHNIIACDWDMSYHLFYQITFYTAYKIIGTNAVVWLLLFSMLQASVITFIFILFKKLLRQAAIPNAFGIALCANLLALLSPYMTEVVAWGATIQYLVSVLGIIISWLLIIRYTETRLLKHLLLAHVVFLLAMYSLEFCVVFPIIIVIYLWLWPKEEKVRFHQYMLILLPELIIIISFFVMNSIYRSSWVGHYGPGVHLNLAPKYMGAQFVRYLLKYIAFVQYYPFSYRNSIYNAAEFDLETYSTLILLYITPLIIFIIKYKKLNSTVKTGMILYAFTCIALLPTQNIYFQYLNRPEDDRFGYFFSFFFYLVFAFILINVFKRTGYVIILLYCIIGTFFLIHEIGDWKKAGNVAQALIKEYKWQNYNGKVHILCIADNIDGAYLFKNFSCSATFDQYYEVMKRKNCSPLQQYLYMTMNNETDSVIANVINDSTLQVDLLTNNKLIMKGEAYASDYDDDDNKVSVMVDKNKPSFQITFKNKKPGDVYIYESGLHWKQVTGF